MKTVAFYSYKGGTGRTLALANVAAFASMAGKKVVVIDMDLEAPGATYKFLPEHLRSGSHARGLVGYLLDLVRAGEAPPSLKRYMLSVPVMAAMPPRRKPTQLWLLPAGDVPAPSYFGELKRLQLDERAADGSATQLLRDLLDRIEEELSPDLVLIDARTGITETNSLILAELASDVFAFFLDLPEQRDGVRNVLRSLAPLAREGSPRLNVVLSRVPIEPEHVGAGWSETDSDKARKTASERFMREPAAPLENTVGPLGVLQLHHYDGLISQELLLLTQLGTAGIAEQPLTWDYARLAREVIGDEAAVADIANGLVRSTWQEAAAAAAVVSGEPSLRSAASANDLVVGKVHATDEASLLDQLGRARAAANRDPASLPELGKILLKVSEAEAALGREEAAAQAAKEAVSVLRHVEAADVSGRVALARALAIAASRLAELEPEEAVATAKSAAAEFRAVGPQSRAAQADFAGVLVLLGRLLDDELISTEYLSEAVGVLRKLTAASQKHEASLASAQIDLSAVYARLGDRELALQTALEAADSARRAFARTARNIVVFGEALNNAAIRYAEVGRPDEAERLLAEAESRLREVNRSNPGQLVLAKVLSNRTLIDRARGNELRALQGLNEVVELYRSLSAGDPTISTQLVRSLTNVGIELARLGHSSEARAAFHEAISVGRESDGGNERQVALAIALVELARLQDVFGETEPALTAGEESLRLLQEITPRTPEIERALSAALTNYSTVLAAAGDLPSAVDHAQKAVRLEESLSQSSPERRRFLAAALLTLGLVQLSSNFNDEEALASIERAVAYFAELASSDNALTTSLAKSLNTMTVALRSRGRTADALTSSIRSVAAFEKAATSEPADVPGLAHALTTFAAILRDLGRNDEALTQSSRAVALYRDLAKQSSAYTLDLNNALDELSDIERQRGKSS